jgi:ABC-type Fe3+ transport system permease subunit
MISRFRRYGAATMLQLPWLLTAPLAVGLLATRVTPEFSDAFIGAVLRSIALAFLTALISTGVGLLGGWLCRNTRSSALDIVMPMLLIPTLIGPLAIGFLAKLSVLRVNLIASAIASRALLPTLVFVVAVYCFQFIPLCLYVFWARARVLPKRFMDYAASAHLTQREIAADLFWPHCRGVFQVLFLLVFMLTATEFAITELAISPSVGTETALLSHWLAEQHRVWFPAGAVVAASELAAYGLTGAILFVLACGITGWLLIRAADHVAWLTKGSARALARPGKRALSDPGSGPKIALFCVCLASVSPLVAGYVAFPPVPFADAGQLAPALLWSLPAAIAMVTSAIALGIFVRLSARGTQLGGGIGTFILAINALAIPPFVLSVALFDWFAAFDPRSFVWVVSGWLLAHVLVAMPVLTAFAVYLHGRVGDGELDYQRSVRVSLPDLVKTSFWDRLRPDYLFVLLFGWSLAWNDGVVNRAAAADVPSLYAVVAPRLSVRPDYRAAQFCLLVSVVASVVMVICWQRLVARREDV